MKCFRLPYSVIVESTEKPKRSLKTVALDRSQLRWEALDLETLIAEDHPARTIWQVSGQLDLTRFEQDTKTLAGDAGRPCWPARLLVSLWVYGYTLGVASARAIGRMMTYEPGLRWLAADAGVNYHTLSDFRVGHEEALRHLFAQFLALLEAAEVIDLSTLLLDGTKVRAVAGRGSLHRRKTLEKRLKQARKVVRELERKAAAEGEAMDEQRRAAQKRAAREALSRAEAALQKMKALEAEASPSERVQLRVSDSEAEARNMKHPDGGWGPSYNLQVTTEGKLRAVVDIAATNAANDTQQLLPALERVKENCGAEPARMIADNGYATRSNVEQSSAQGTELIAPWKEGTSREAGACARNGIEAGFVPSKFRTQRGGKKLTCPAGKSLVVIEQKMHHGVLCNVFGARQKDCAGCRFKKACCGAVKGPRRVARVVESRAMKQYLARMKRPEVRELYGKRCEVAEFPHLWFKAVKKWRRFSVRGLIKAGMEALWVALAYNITQWIRVQTPGLVAA
jgi:transposase